MFGPTYFIDFQIQRGLSSGQQSYETDPSLYPVNKPIPKIEGQSQCTGNKYGCRKQVTLKSDSRF